MWFNSVDVLTPFIIFVNLLILILKIEMKVNCYSITLLAWNILCGYMFDIHMHAYSRMYLQASIIMFLIFVSCTQLNKSPCRCTCGGTRNDNTPPNSKLLGGRNTRLHSPATPRMKSAGKSQSNSTSSLNHELLPPGLTNQESLGCAVDPLTPPSSKVCSYFMGSDFFQWKPNLILGASLNWIHSVENSVQSNVFQ